jgi:hypothetical protein
MIDDFDEAMELVNKLSAQLPIPAFPGKPFIEMMHSKGKECDENYPLQVERILYGADSGGILCSLIPLDNDKEAYVVSITHLRFPSEHFLFNEIYAYQQQRLLGLSVLGGKGRKFVKKAKKKKKGFGK